ncbi:MAG TPA: NADH-quinone oxidoreductase subunit J [Pyrinomonadaceae bacterium]|nr:NADH-quinone oxidoreductase subunit J [Pyrinomonadaceae bacterium]
MLVLLFILFAGLAIGCAIALVAQRNPLYSAISLIGVFISLACLYVTLAAPFIAAVQVIVYAGAIMVLVVFVIMLLNVEQEERRRRSRLGFLVPAAVVLAAILVAEATFIIWFVDRSPVKPVNSISDTGLTSSIGSALFTKYLLPFEITSILLLMAIVGAMTLARRIKETPPGAAVLPGTQVLPLRLFDPNLPLSDTRAAEAHSTEEAAEMLGVSDERDPSERD